MSLIAMAEKSLAVTATTRENAVTQQSAMEQTASAINEMSASVQEVAQSSSRAAGAANQVSEDVEQDSKVVQETVETINRLAVEVHSAGEVIHQLSAHAETIGSVLDAIRTIAEQTNLLALNAAFEAARAGEQGRGFAVVADEVRTLAKRTHDSTREVQQMIEQLQSGAARVVEVMGGGRTQADVSVRQATMAGESLRQILISASIITDMNAQIASALEEQNVVAEDINRNIGKIAGV